MTASVSCEEHYYYDGDSKKFFYTMQASIDTDDRLLLSMIDLPITGSERTELLRRIEHIDSNCSEIVEIPRLNVQDKVGVQLLFLSKFSGIHHEEELRLAVEQQKDNYGFVLDIITTKYDVLAPMEPYWEDFKLKTIQYYLEKFTGVVGISFRLTQ